MFQLHATPRPREDTVWYSPVAFGSLELESTSSRTVESTGTRASAGMEWMRVCFGLDTAKEGMIKMLNICIYMTFYLYNIICAHNV